MNEVLLFTQEVKTVEDLSTLLTRCGNIDADFCGDNGDKYLWDDARDKGFETNAEYLADKVMFHTSVNARKHGIKAYTKKFASEWMKNDTYWDDINIIIEKIDIPERNYTDMQGMYAVCVYGEYSG